MGGGLQLGREVLGNAQGFVGIIGGNSVRGNKGKILRVLLK